MESGDKVLWESQARGPWKEKRGVVIAEIPAGRSAKNHVPATAKKSHIKFDKNISEYDRVLVAVPAGKGCKITHYYCPCKKILSMEGEENGAD